MRCNLATLYHMAATSYRMASLLDIFKLHLSLFSCDRKNIWESSTGILTSNLTSWNSEDWSRLSEAWLIWFWAYWLCLRIWLYIVLVVCKSPFGWQTVHGHGRRYEEIVPKLDSKVPVSAQWSEFYTLRVLFCGIWAHTLVFHLCTDWKRRIQLDVEEQASTYMLQRRSHVHMCDFSFWDLDKWLANNTLTYIAWNNVNNIRPFWDL